MAAQIKSFDTIKTNKMFRKIPPGDIKIKVSSNNYLEKKEGDIVFQSGDPGDFIYLILSGDVKIKLPTLSGPRIEKRGANDFIGENEFFEGTARTSSAVAETNCVIYPLTRKEVNDLITKNRSILNNLQNIEESDGYAPQISEFEEEISSSSNFDEPAIEEPEFKTSESSFIESAESSFSDSSFQETPESIFIEPAGSSFIDTPQQDIGHEAEDDAFFSTSPEPSITPDDFEAKLQDVRNLWGTEDTEPTKFETPEPPAFDEEEPLSDDFNFDELHKEFSMMNETASADIPDEPGEAPETQVPAPHEKTKEQKPNFNFASFKTVPSEETQAADNSIPYPSVDENTDELPADFSSWDFSGNISDDEKNEIDKLIEIDTPEKFSDLQLELSSPSEFNEFEGMKDIESFPVPPEISEKLDKEIAETEYAEVERLVPEAETGFDDFPIPEEIMQEISPQPAAELPVEAPLAKPGLTADQLRLIVKSAEKVNSNIKLDDVLNSIVEVASELTNADRGTLYLIDEEQNELWSKVIQGLEAKEIRLKIGQGLAGSAAETNQTVNVPDASLDERFNAGFDMATGYVTKSVLCFPIKNKDGKAIGVLQLINSKNGSFSELDEQFLEALSINAAIALENAELVEQLLRTDRLTSLGKMAGFILQDIKKPIITIKHFAEHIKKKQVPPDIKQVLDMQIEQANSVVNLVQTTLSYSEGKSILQTQVQSLNQVLDTILLMLAEFVEAQKVKLFKKYDKDVLVSIDKNEFYQACYQITKNACEAMPSGGNLYFATQIVDDAVEISIRDTGLGIPDSIKERIFEPFMCHGKKQGTGLGLSITEKIIKDHRGTITAESNLGEGTTFFISLPIARKL